MDEILTLGEAGNYLKVGERTVRRMIKDGQIVATKVGKQWRISKRLLQEYVERGIVKPHRTSILDQYERRTEKLGTMAQQVRLVTNSAEDDNDRYFVKGFASGIEIATTYLKDGNMKPIPMILINDALTTNSLHAAT